MSSKELLELFSKVRVSVSDETFLLASMKRGYCDLIGEALSSFQFFSSIVLERDELTLIVSEEDWSRVSSFTGEYQLQGPFKLIDFGLELDLDVVGFLAEVTRSLAEEGVSVLAVSTFRRDYLLVKASDVEHALEALRSFLNECKKRW